jgi:mannose-6-phosphate isomerase-like protein (cupin superfamily)
MSAITLPESFWFFDTLVTIRIPHTQGADTISLLEHHAPRGHSPPLHIHRTEDELFRVVTGDFRFQVGSEEHRLTSGAFLLTPKGVPHTFRVESTQGGRWLTVTTHTDFERFVRAVGRPAPRVELPPTPGPPTGEQAAHLAEVAARYGIELVGPPLH